MCGCVLPISAQLPPSFKLSRVTRPPAAITEAAVGALTVTMVDVVDVFFMQVIRVPLRTQTCDLKPQSESAKVD